jgi:hypothetical protein
MGNWQDAPAASVPGSEEPALNTVQAEAPLSFSVKFAAMLGLFPVDGIGKFNAALPTFSTVTVCGLSVLVEPKAVLAKEAGVYKGRKPSLTPVQAMTPRKISALREREKTSQTVFAAYLNGPPSLVNKW